MPPLASIDVGSNTIRLLIGKVEKDRIVRIKCEMAITRLAEGIQRTARLNDNSIEKSLLVLKRFSSLLSENKVSHIKAVGTSALREGKNSKIFITRVLTETGIKIDVIPGRKEAELTAKGVLLGMANDAPSLIIDIGGGSTEWILCRDKAVNTGTIPAGVVKLLENHIKTDPPTVENTNSLDKETKNILNKLRSKIGNRINDKTAFIGTAGTITTIAAIDLGLETYDHEKIHMHHISIRRLREISEELVGMPLNERRKIKGLEPGRADLIIPGILFTIKIMETFGFGDLIVSDNGLLEGALLQLSEEVQN